MIIVLMMLIYLVIGYSTVMIMRNRTLDILRLVSGVAFMLMVLIYSLSLVNSSAVIVFVLGLSLMMSIEIVAFIVNNNDLDIVFLIYAFRTMFAVVLIIMIFTNYTRRLKYETCYIYSFNRDAAFIFHKLFYK